MNAAGQTICLNMIVKNEAPVIRRCLDSVRPIIDHWVIVDTGSSDGTQDIIRDHLRDLPGELHERPWQDFAYNRSEALELARGKSDYTLIIDADDTLAIAPEVRLATLTADSYTLEISDNTTVYRRPQLVRSQLAWRYEGVLHEFLTCDDAGAAAHLSAVRMQRNHDGARRKDPQTYRRDVAVLEAALQTEASAFLRARYRFYLAQSYRDSGNDEKALEHDLLRADLGFWQEEVFISLYRAAQVKEKLGHPDQEVIAAYLRATDAQPSRAEALHGASRFCRRRNRFEEGFQLARRGLDIPMPGNALFVEPWVYETGLLDELSVNAYWSGHHRACVNASLKILATGKLSASETRRIIANAQFAGDKLATDPKLAACANEDFAGQHAAGSADDPLPPLTAAPRVLVAIRATQKARVLPLYLACIEALDYPKSSIVLDVRTNDSTDATERLLRDWLGRVGHLYGGVEFDAEDGAGSVGHRRTLGLARTRSHECAFYFTADVDNFIRPRTLRDLVALNLPIVAPFLRSIGPGHFYSNYHADIDSNGYYAECDQYFWILNRWIRGVQKLPVVHSTYLVRADSLDDLSYDDGSSRHEYVIFSHSARNAQIPQYLDNRQVYGYITFDEGHDLHVPNDIAQARALLR
jgi:hypothetical protein